MTTPDLAQQLFALRQEFAAKLPAKLTALDVAVRAAIHDRTKLAAATMLAHRLRGSAGSFGQPTVGVAVGRIEELLEQAAAGSAGPGLEGDLLRLLEAAASAISAAVAAGPMRPPEEPR